MQRKVWIFIAVLDFALTRLNHRHLRFLPCLYFSSRKFLSFLSIPPRPLLFFHSLSNPSSLPTTNPRFCCFLVLGCRYLGLVDCDVLVVREWSRYWWWDGRCWCGWGSFSPSPTCWQLVEESLARGQDWLWICLRNSKAGCERFLKHKVKNSRCFHG